MKTRIFFITSFTLGMAFSVRPQGLDENTVVSVLNRTARVRPDGTWRIDNVPANMGLVRVRATRVLNGVTTFGQSDFVNLEPNIENGFSPFELGNVDATPTSLVITGPGTLTGIGNTAQLTATTTYPDNSTRNATAAAAGTSYTISNPNTASITPGGLVTALASGTVVVSAINDGAIGMFQLRVVLTGDSDGDGIPDDLEIANGLNPNNPVDAEEDADKDGVTNKAELQDFGSNMRLADTDGDGIRDGEEAVVGQDGFVTSLVSADTDGDGVRDKLEVDTGSDPSNPASLNLAQALQSCVVTPSSFVLTVNAIVGEASRQLVVSGSLKDGTTIDLTSTARGTAYNSSDLFIANFGSPDGRVFAGNNGTATITVSNSGFIDSAEVIVQSFGPTALSFVNIPGFANNVDVNGSYAYVAAGSAGLQVVDVSDRNAPVVVASRDTPGNANDVKVLGDLALVADGAAGLQVIDISNPLVPVIIGAFDTPGVAHDVFRSGNRVYVADGTFGLQIIDISNPANPTFAGSVDTPGTAKGVAVSGSLAVVADGVLGIQVINISNPATPSIIGSRSTGGDARDVAINGGFAYVADGSRSFTPVSIIDPTNPVLGTSTPSSTGGLLQDAEILGRFAFGADFFFVNGVPIIDVGLATPYWATDFNSGVPLEISGVGVLTGVQGYAGVGGFDGNFLRNDTLGGRTTLRLQNLPPHTHISLGFLLAVIDSWDGGDAQFGPDRFVVSVDGNDVFNHMVGWNNPTFVPDPGVTLALETALGFNPEFVDAAYNMGLQQQFRNIPHSSSSLTVEFYAGGAGWQGGEDESFAVENLSVTLHEGLGANLANAPLPRSILNFAGFRDDNGTGIAVDNQYVYLTAELNSITENGVTGNTRLYIGQYMMVEDGNGIAPNVEITSPLPPANLVSGMPIGVTAEADDDVGVQTVSFLLNGTPVSTDLGAPYEGTITVPLITDTTPPRPVGVTVDSQFRNITVSFDEMVQKPSAESLVNYLFNGTIPVTAAAWKTGGKSITVTAATPLPLGTTTLMMSGIRDLRGNIVQPNTGIEFDLGPGAYTSIVQADGPVAYFSFEEDAGSTVAQNKGSSGINGLYNIGATGTGSARGEAGPRPPGLPGFVGNNRAASFGGFTTSEWIETQSAYLNNRSSFSLECWMLTANRLTQGDRVGIVGQNDSVEFGFIMPSTIQVWTPAGGSLNTPYAFPNAEWHHVATVGDGAFLRTYFDGVLQNQVAVSTLNYGSAPFNTHIGGGGVFDPTGNFFNGQIDEVAIFDNALTAAQIATHFKAGKEGAVGVTRVLPIVPPDGAGGAPPTVTLAAQAIDHGGNVGVSAPLVFNIVPNLPPDVSIDSPQTGSTYIEEQMITVNVLAADDVGVGSVRLFANGSLVSIDTTFPYQFSFTFPVGVSQVLFSAVATDILGTTGQSENVLVSVIPDPGTAVVGRVVDETGIGVEGASVTVLDSFTGTSGIDGNFIISGVPTIRGPIQGSASVNIGGTLFQGISQQVLPVVGGITEVGDLVLVPLPGVAYVSNNGDDSVSVVSIETKEVIATIPVGDGPGPLAVVPDGSRVFVVNQIARTVSVIDTVAQSVIATIPVGNEPTQIVITRDGLRAYVANTSSASISVIDTVLNTVMETIPTPSAPSALAIHPVRDELWIGFNAPGTVLQVRSLANHAVLATRTSTSRLYASVGLAFHPNGSEAFGVEGCGACGRFHRISGTISAGSITILEQDILQDNSGSALGAAINPVTGAVYLAKFGHRVVEFGTGRQVNFPAPPLGLAVTSDGKFLFVALQATPGTVSIIDTATLTSVGTVTVGSSPRGITIWEP
jgi:YVTN family beta-propeller protein